MKPIDSFRNRVIQGDCIEVMEEIPDNSIDACVTDPDYGIDFMSKEKFKGTPREYQAWTQEWAIEVMRVLKPGAHMLVFGIPRMYHRMASGVEDVGFEIRDQIQWVFSSGFPKSHNIGKAVDELQGNEREIVGTKRCGIADGPFGSPPEEEKHIKETKGDSPWEGWGTALKPAHEDILLARKPISERNIAENVLEWGCGGINVDRCRIETTDKLGRPSGTMPHPMDWGTKDKVEFKNNSGDKGRFPANLVLSHDERCSEVGCHQECPVRLLDEQSGKNCGGRWGKSRKNTGKTSMFGIGRVGNANEFIGDSGSASRFFYCAKASPTERDRGLEEYGMKNTVPTVKPLDLCRYLVRLVTPPNGIVLDPFAGSGSILIACVLEGFDYIGIELEQDYVDIANARLGYWGLPEHERKRYDRKQRSRERRESENMIGLDRWLK